MDEIISPVIGLIGVLVGGFVSYLTQTRNDKRIERRNDKRQKHIAYNKFLLLEGMNSPLVHGVHSDSERDFLWEVYAEGTRKVLYDNLHLLHSEIVWSVLQIDIISEEAEVMGPDYIYINRLYGLYEEIKDWIIKDYRYEISQHGR
ncbi:hypothetical protein [Sporosarcina sp. ITBMC105]